MNKTRGVAFALALIAAACAAPDPMLVDAPEVADPQPVAAFSDVAAEPVHVEGDGNGHDEDSGHTDGDAHHEDAVTGHHDDGSTDHHEEAVHAEGDAHHEEAGGHTGGEIVEAELGTHSSEVTVVIREFEIRPVEIEVVPGETVRFTLMNTGEVEHEFRLSDHHRVEEHIASGHADHGDGEGHHGESADLVLFLAPGETRVVDIAFPEDTSVYTVATCLVPGHNEAGMVAELVYLRG
ncbi:MAG TPA: hypothetical protein VIY70_06670 [Acidimicrobiia bacterium]